MNFAFIIPCLTTFIIVFYFDYKIRKLENEINNQKILISMLIYDYLKRNKKNIKTTKINKDVIDELFK